MATGARPEARPGQFRCAICGGIFDLGDEDEAQAEREANGLAGVECGMVCDACYRKTPWGMADDEGREGD